MIGWTCCSWKKFSLVTFSVDSMMVLMCTTLVLGYYGDPYATMCEASESNLTVHLQDGLDSGVCAPTCT